MTITPYSKLGSQDILSAHLNGLQYGINNLETVLDLKTDVKTDYPLVPVIDMDDPTLRYRIYEANDRNWLTNPAPVIKRKGVVVPTSEYVVQPAYGVVVFNVQQKTNDDITANFTHVKAESNKLAGYDTEIGKIAPLDARVTANEASIGKLQNIKGSPQPINLYHSHSNGVPMAVTTTTYNVNVQTGANNMDAFPFMVSEKSTFRTMRINVGTPAGSKLKMAVYSSEGGYPKTKLAETAEIDVSTANTVKEADFITGDLVLEEGQYWLVRWQDNTVYINDGLSHGNAIHLGDPFDASVIDTVGGAIATTGGIRVNIVYDGILRNPFPTIANGAKYLRRTTYASPWIKRKA
jgi:hypothetical protein